MTLSSKLPNAGTTIFTVMSHMAQAHNAINLSQGFPDFNPPAPLLDLMDKYLRGGYNQYPPMMGVPYLREQIAHKVHELYGVQVDPDAEITVTSGATESLFVAVQALVHPGHEVIVLDPCYDAYEPVVTLAGGKTVHVPLTTPDYLIDYERLEAAITEHTRLVVLNFPHNPCGSNISLEDLQRLSDLLGDREIYLLSDEVYEHMVFDGLPHASLLRHPDLRKRSLVVSSFGKTYHATGWKVAYCIAPDELTAEFRKVHQFVTFTTHTPSQWALAEFMETCPEHYLELPDFYQAKRDLFLDAMKDSGFRMTPSPSTYFQLAEYSNVSGEADIAFVTHLTQDVGVAAIPISVFYEDPPEQRVIRFCFAKEDATIIEAAGKLTRMDHP